MSSSYESTTDTAAIAAALGAAERIVLTTHQKPDGDAIGSVLALGRGLIGLGKDVTVLLMGPVEPALRVLAGPTPIVLFEDIDGPPDDADVIVVTDTGAWSQLEPLRPWLEEHRERVIGIDHHARGDDVTARRIVDTGAGAVTQLIIPLLEALGVTVDGERFGIGEPLFAGLATDTGWFRHPNANDRAFRDAARLLEAGVDKSWLYQVIEETARPARLHLLGRALGSLESIADGEVTLMSLSLSDFAETGGSLEDLTGLVNEPMCVGSIRVSILVTERENESKLSFRSKPATEAGGTFWNVNELAHGFGGGGHVHAAGARIVGGLDVALARIRAHVEASRP